MSDLKASIHEAIATYVESKTDTHTPVDVLRMVRDQASLLYERQLICDALDADPMQELGQVTSHVKRVQRLLNVTSVTRTVTLDGYCRNDAVVELNRDGRMADDVKTSVQLTFHYERRLKAGETTTTTTTMDEQQNTSRIQYTIDVSKDCGQKERLLIIEVFALGEGPSVEPAEPIDEEEWEDADDDADDDAMDTSVDQEEAIKSSNRQEDKDRYAAFMDPDVLNTLLTWTQLGMNELEAFFFLMTFPYFEHEWDLVGFALDSVFAGDGAESMESGDDDSIENIEEQDDESDV